MIEPQTSTNSSSRSIQVPPEFDLFKLMEIVNKAGDDLLSRFEKRHFAARDSLNCPTPVYKSAKELVIDADLASQEIILKELGGLYPEFHCYSEESSNWQEYCKDENYKFMIDPLDGTHNFFFGLPQWAVTLAVLDPQSFPIMSVISIPSINLTIGSDGSQVGSTKFYRGKKPLHLEIGDKRPLDKSIFAFDNQLSGADQKVFSRLSRIIDATFTTRISGSAAFDAAMIASGKIDGRIWHNIKAYDFASLIPIIRGAGGVVVDFGGTQVTSLTQNQAIGCSHQELANELLPYLGDSQNAQRT